jgi:hypothetical protein
MKSDFRLTLAVVIVAAGLTLAGCSSSEADQANTAEAQKSSGGLGSLFASTKPVVVPEGTQLAITLDQSLASNQQKSGDEFDASVAAPVVVDGKTVIPKGAKVTGRVVEARESGRLKGVAVLKLALVSVEVDGKDYDLQTTSVTRSGKNHNKRNAVLIGGGTGVGAAIGAAAGGGKGALIGGAIGAGAGTGTAVATGKLDITIPAETQFSFKLTQPVTVQVKG